MPRRSRQQLERAVAAARTPRTRATAHYRLALFHDNNGREALAIPHYRRALALGLANPNRQRAMAWLASSLFKTAHPAEALRWIDRGLAASGSPAVDAFLRRLRSRIQRQRRGGQ